MCERERERERASEPLTLMTKQVVDSGISRALVDLTSSIRKQKSVVLGTELCRTRRRAKDIMTAIQTTYVHEPVTTHRHANNHTLLPQQHNKNVARLQRYEFTKIQDLLQTRMVAFHGAFLLPFFMHQLYIVLIFNSATNKRVSHMCDTPVLTTSAIDSPITCIKTS